MWLVSLADPTGFMGLFNDAYSAVARAICFLGKQPFPIYWTKPSAKAQKLEEQLSRYPDAKVMEIDGALNESAQQKLITITERLVGVNPPEWLHMKQLAPRIITAKPKFEPLD